MFSAFLSYTIRYIGSDLTTLSFSKVPLQPYIINKKVYFYGVAHTVDSNGVMFTFLVG